MINLANRIWLYNLLNKLRDYKVHSANLQNIDRIIKFGSRGNSIIHKCHLISWRGEYLPFAIDFAID